MSNDYSKSVGVDGGQGKHRGPRFTWNTQYEATFFRSLCESVQLGLREGSTFKPEAWDRAIQALIEKHNAFANKGHLINKSDNARKKYRLWRGLREDPEFYYNQQTKSVNGSEEAWTRHLQKEPLARSLKGRPFEHEEYFEILFPDVIGSGGAPKRMTKPRRKGPDIINGIEEHEGPGTSLMDMLSDASYLNPVQSHLPPPVQPNAIPPPMPAPLPPQPQQLSRPPPAPMAPPPPPRASTVSTGSALTPPEENPAQSRNKRQHNDTNRGPSPSQPEKRRRTQAPNYIDLQQSNKTTNSNSHVNGNTVNGNVVNGNSSAGSNTSTGNVNTGGNTTTTHTSNNNSHSAAASSSAIAALATPTVTSSGTISDGITLVLEALRGAKARPMWQEQAMEIFFRDFREEDPDLQLKIAEKVLTDENKAMFFCKMPEPLRNHWVKRLREVHNRAT